MQIQVLFKNRASDCNKELLEFLHRNIEKIRVHFRIQAIILTTKPAHKLPAMIVKGKTYEGASAIMNKLKTMYLNKVRPKTDDDRVRSFMAEQMATKDDDNDQNTGDIAKKLAAEAFKKREQNQQSRKSNIPKSSPAITAKARPGKKQSGIKETLPSEMEKDPLVAKFWANKGL